MYSIIKMCKIAITHYLLIKRNTVKHRSEVVFGVCVILFDWGSLIDQQLF